MPVEKFSSIYPTKFEAAKQAPDPTRAAEEKWDIKAGKKKETVFILEDPVAFVGQWSGNVDGAHQAGRDQDIRDAYAAPAMAALAKARESWMSNVGPVGMAANSSSSERRQNADRLRKRVLEAGRISSTARILAAEEADLERAVTDLEAYYLGGVPAPGVLAAEIDARAQAMVHELTLIFPPPGATPPELLGLVKGLALDQARAVLRRKLSKTEEEFSAQSQRERDYPWAVFGGAVIPETDFKPSAAELQRKEFETAAAEFGEAADQKRSWGASFLTRAYAKPTGREVLDKPSKATEIPARSFKAIYQQAGGRRLLEEFAAYIVYYRPVIGSGGVNLGPLQHAGIHFEERRRIVAEKVVGHIANTPDGKKIIEAAWDMLFVGHLGESAQTREASPLNGVVDNRTGRPVLDAGRTAIDPLLGARGDLVFPPDAAPPALPYINQRSTDTAIAGDLWRLMHPLEGVLAQLNTGESWGSVGAWVKTMVNRGLNAEVATEVRKVYLQRLGKSFFEMQKVWADDGAGGQEQVPMLQALLLKRQIDFDKSFETRTAPMGKYTADLGDLKGPFDILSGATKVEYKIDAASVVKMAQLIGETLRGAGMDTPDNRRRLGMAVAFDIRSRRLGIPLTEGDWDFGGKLNRILGVGAGGSNRIADNFFPKDAFL